MSVVSVIILLFEQIPILEVLLHVFEVHINDLVTHVYVYRCLNSSPVSM
jgi:hypothetical protein